MGFGLVKIQRVPVRGVVSASQVGSRTIHRGLIRMEEEM